MKNQINSERIRKTINRKPRKSRSGERVATAASKPLLIIKGEMIISIPLKEGQRLILLGEKIEDNIFKAEKIKPFMGKGGQWLPKYMMPPFLKPHR